MLNRGAQRITLNCGSGRCEPTPMPGDGKNAYEPADGVIAAHQSAARRPPRSQPLLARRANFPIDCR